MEPSTLSSEIGRMTFALSAQARPRDSESSVSESESCVAHEARRGTLDKETDEKHKKATEVVTAPEDNNRNSDELPRPIAKKLSVAALIRSFSPRSRAKSKADDQRTTKAATTFGKLRRSTLSFPASPRKLEKPVQPVAQGPSNDRGQNIAVVGSVKSSNPESVSKWKQAVTAVVKDAARLKIQIPDATPNQEKRSPSQSSSGVDREFLTGPGSFVEEVRSTLAKLLTALDGVDPRKLSAIRLGGELRGLLGKAQDEFTAYEEAFRDHAASVGVFIALQNFAASLHQVFPIVERLQTAKFLLNRQFKQEVTFAFQEINSYYTSMFMELSMAVANRAGVVLPIPKPIKTVVPKEELEEDGVPVTEMPREPTGDDVCMAAHQKFFGHGCQVDMRAACELYTQAAKKGCVAAMRCLGHMYAQGRGVERDNFVAEMWLSQAAAAGDTEAYYLLGCLLCEQAPAQKTPQLTRDFFAQAQRHLTVAAECGLSDAQYRLAVLLEAGHSGEQDALDLADRTALAFPWYRRAAEQRHAKAEAAVGRILLLQYNDNTVTGSSGKATNGATEAIHWLQRAISASNEAEALMLLGMSYNTGLQGVKQDRERGAALLRRAASAGSHEAMLQLAKILLSFELDTLDREDAHDEAMQLLLVAAQQGQLAEALHQIGELLYGSKLLRDRGAALRFFVRAARSQPPHATAAKRAAAMFYSGVGCKSVDKKQAYHFYTIAADGGDAEALNALGLMNEDGEGCDLDFTKAADCYRRAVELGSAHAHFNLGCLLAHGKGVARNLDSAQAHFQKAFSLGYTLAKDFIRCDT